MRLRCSLALLLDRRPLPVAPHTYALQRSTGFVDLIRRQGVDGGGCQVLCADDDEEEHAAGENKTPAKPMGTVRART